MNEQYWWMDHSPPRPQIFRFGVRERFAIEIGPFFDASNSVRRVDVWAADRWLTCDDNNVYVPHFAELLSRAVSSFLISSEQRGIDLPAPELSVEENYRRLRAEANAGDNSGFFSFRFMDWGPTADNVSACLFWCGENVQIAFSFWRPTHPEPDELGKVFVAELPWWELASILHDAAWKLMWDWSDRSKWNPAQPIPEQQ